MKRSYDTIVVGGGISGLACAYRLHCAGQSVLLLEAGPEVGGVIRSERIPGVGVIDHGPQTVRSKDPELFAEFRELGIEDDRLVAGASGSNRYIFWEDQLVPLPHSPGSFLSSPVLPASAKLRLMLEPFRQPRRGQDESIEDFFGHRLGPQAVARLVDPFVSGVYAGDTRQLSVRAVFPGLAAGVDEKGSLVRWGISKAREAGKARRSSGAPRVRPELFSFKEGLGAWPQALAAALGPGGLRTETPVKGASFKNGEWRVTLETGGKAKAASLVLAVPAPAAAGILGQRFPADVRQLRDIPYAPISTVHLAWEREAIQHPLDGFGYLCPSSQGRRFLGVLWISSLFPERVEEGRVLTTTFVGGARQPDQAVRPEAELVDLAIREHRRTLGARGEPLVARAITHRQGIPQYEFGHLDRVAAAERMEDAGRRLYLTGSWRGGLSVPDCWKGGRATADRILSDPATPSTSPEVERREAKRPRAYPGRDQRGSPTGPGAAGT
jgi:oxygen-dependent protoporphyrinogen oxidase